MLAANLKWPKLLRAASKNAPGRRHQRLYKNLQESRQALERICLGPKATLLTRGPISNFPEGFPIGPGLLPSDPFKIREAVDPIIIPGA